MKSWYSALHQSLSRMSSDTHACKDATPRLHNSPSVSLVLYSRPTNGLHTKAWQGNSICVPNQ